MKVEWSFAIATALLPITGFAGNESHGGDTVHCDKAEQNTFEGYWNLDYLLTYSAQNGNADVVNSVSWDESRKRIGQLLKTKAPDFLPSFQSFADDLYNSFDFNKSHIWEDGAFGLVLVKKEDEQYQFVDRYLPKNCYAKNGTGEINLIRTVTRTKKNGATFYTFDSQVINSLSPLQQSFLLVHEWLRDFTQDERMIRQANRLLHSSMVDPAAYDLKSAFRTIGLSASPAVLTGFIPVCDRSPGVRDIFELHYGKRCNEIFGNTLNNLFWELNLKNSGIHDLNPGDFGGFANLHRINLSQNQLTDLVPGTFHQLKLQSLDLNHNQLQAINKGDFSNMQIGYLDLSENRIEVLEAGALNEITAIDYETALNIDLSKNQLTDLNPKAFSAYMRGALNVSSNKLTIIRKDLFQTIHVGSAKFDSNLISDIESGAFATEIQYGLSLAKNRLNSIGAEMFAGLRIEYDLNLSENEIEMIADRAFEQTTFRNSTYNFSELNLAKNRIQKISDATFAGVTNLSQLNLSSNQLTSVPAGLISLVKSRKINVLVLKDNPLSKEWKDYLQAQLSDRVQL